MDCFHFASPGGTEFISCVSAPTYPVTLTCSLCYFFLWSLICNYPWSSNVIQNSVYWPRLPSIYHTCYYLPDLQFVFLFSWSWQRSCWGTFNLLCSVSNSQAQFWCILPIQRFLLSLPSNTLSLPFIGSLFHLKKFSFSSLGIPKQNPKWTHQSLRKENSVGYRDCWVWIKTLPKKERGSLTWGKRPHGSQGMARSVFNTFVKWRVFVSLAGMESKE